MEIISGLNTKRRCLCDIEIYPYLRDHRLEDKAVLPAVESLIVLAGALRTNYPDREIGHLRRAVFSRFLAIGPETTSQPVMIDFISHENDVLSASLSTFIKSKTSDISREVEHVRVDFCAGHPDVSTPAPFPVVHKLKGNCISIPSTTVYRELVPFGMSYQNIAGDVSVSGEGALAYISGGHHGADDALLGSPFPLDATMHLACVWGQRFAGIVSFPVGFEKRVIYRKTKKQEEYLGRIVPVNRDKESLIFDAWIYQEDVICEVISGLVMKDVTKGRMRPPDWIKV